MAEVKATLGGGCFWCVEAVYLRINGVKSVVSGYAGGQTSNPTYREICSGTTGHAEVIQITFDDALVSFKEILEIFWQAHDPTTLNRQGADVGTQYRSVIYAHDETQLEEARQSKAALDQSGRYANPAVTEIQMLPTFYEAEGYHQSYYDNNPNQGYCRAVIHPKLQKLGMA